MKHIQRYKLFLESNTFNESDVNIVEDFFQEYIDKYHLNRVDHPLDINNNEFSYVCSLDTMILTIKTDFKKHHINNISSSRPFGEPYGFFLDDMSKFLKRLENLGYSYDYTIIEVGNRINIFIKCPKAYSPFFNPPMNSIKESFNNDKTLYIFDLDDTLVNSPSFEDLAVPFLKEGVTIKGLLKKSVNVINASLSDLKWQNNKIYIDDPEEKIDVKQNWVRKGKRVYLTSPDKFYYSDLSLPVSVTKLSDLYKSVENKCIITGRIEPMRSKVEESLNKLGLEYPKYGLFCYPNVKKSTNQIQEPSGRVPAWKAKTIIDLIKNNNFEKAIFYDDNSKWVNIIDKIVKKELPDLDWKSIKYKK